LHKNISPQTYACQLCAVTYNNYGMVPEWKAFVESLPLSVAFLHKDEWIQAYKNADTDLPAAFLVEGATISVCIPASQMRVIPDVKTLITVTQKVVSEL